MNAQEIQLGHEVQVAGTLRYGTVIAIQRRRHRAEIRDTHGERRWYPVRELRRVVLGYRLLP